MYVLIGAVVFFFFFFIFIFGKWQSKYHRSLIFFSMGQSAFGMKIQDDLDSYCNSAKALCLILDPQSSAGLVNRLTLWTRLNYGFSSQVLGDEGIRRGTSSLRLPSVTWYSSGISALHGTTWFEH